MCLWRVLPIQSVTLGIYGRQAVLIVGSGSRGGRANTFERRNFALKRNWAWEVLFVETKILTPFNFFHQFVPQVGTLCSNPVTSVILIIEYWSTFLLE